MKNKFKILLSLLVILVSHTIQGQSSRFSLNEAVDYALKTHPDVKNKELSEKYSDAQVMETRAIGIPQVSANVQFVNNIQKQVFVFPNPATGKNEPIRVGNNYTTSAVVSASWLALDASYFLGLKAAQALTDLAKLQTNMNKQEVAVNVTKAYYLVLITRENVDLLKENIKTLETIYNQTEAYYKNGFAEKVDVDRLKLTLSNLNVQLESLNDQAVITEKLLKLNMGMPIESAIELTDNLEALYKAVNQSLSNEFSPKDRVEFQILKSQQTLTTLDKKRFEVSKYPNLAFFANYQQNNFSETINFNTWYANSFWGFRMGIPIFSGMNNKAQLIKRDVNLAQIQNTIQAFENASKLEAQSALVRYNRSLKTLEVQKQNLELANEILRISSVKLKEGIGSNLEITNAQQELKTSQTNYLNAIFDLLNAQIELKKAYGKL